MATTIRTPTLLLAALLASAAHAQQWVQVNDPLRFDKPPPIWCNELPVVGARGQAAESTAWMPCPRS